MTSWIVYAIWFALGSAIFAALTSLLANHLYETDELNLALDEAIRVTKPGGVILFAFISVFAIMYANYFYGNWAEGQAENFTDDYQIRHFKEQLFTRQA